MKIILYAGKQAGMVALLTLCAIGKKPMFVIPEDKIIEDISKDLKIPILPKTYLKEINYPELDKLDIDLFICCHGRRIIPKIITDNIHCINLHPCLYKMYI